MTPTRQSFVAEVIALRLTSESTSGREAPRATCAARTARLAAAPIPTRSCTWPHRTKCSFFSSSLLTDVGLYLRFVEHNRAHAIPSGPEVKAREVALSLHRAQSYRPAFKSPTPEANIELTHS